MPFYLFTDINYINPSVLYHFHHINKVPLTNSFSLIDNTNLNDNTIYFTNTNTSQYIYCTGESNNIEDFIEYISNNLNQNFILSWKVDYLNLITYDKLMKEEFSCNGLGSHSTGRIYKKLFDGNIYPQNFKHYFKYKLFKNRNYIINEYDNLEDLNEVIDLIKLQGEVNKEMSYEQDTEIVNKPNFFE